MEESAPERTKLVLTTGRSVNLQRERVIAIAGEMPESDGSRVSVLVNDRAVDVVPLVARAARRTSDEITPLAAMQALKDLGLRGADVPADSEPQGTAPAGPFQSKRKPRASSRSSTQTTTYASQRELAAYTGKWVAILMGKVIASGESLDTLQRDLGRREATVMFLPRSGEGGQL